MKPAKRRKRNLETILSGLDRAVARLDAETGRRPFILDWHTGEPWNVRLPAVTVFSPVSREFEPVLPYLDRSIDLVMLSGSRAEHAGEAARVARHGVILVDPDAAAPEDALRIAWLGQDEPALPRVSIVIPTWNRRDLVLTCLLALERTLPEGFAGEVVVVDDCSPDDTWEALAFAAARNPLVRPVRPAANAGFVDACNLGASAATGDILFFLNHDTQPLAGWLEPVLRTFHEDASVGVVGSKLVYPDGRLQEAGGVVFADGSAANFGRGLAADDPLVGHLRDVDYVSGAALAIRRELFARLGGFDVRFRPAYYEDTDLCMAARAAGCRVVFQPESVIVHHEGSVHGADLATGVKRHQAINAETFREKWAATLSGHPARPERFDRAAWLDIAFAEGRP